MGYSMSAGENQAGWCLRGGVVHRRSPTGSSLGSDACGDPSGGGTVHRDRSTSHGSVKQEATGTNVMGHLPMSCRTVVVIVAIKSMLSTA